MCRRIRRLPRNSGQRDLQPVDDVLRDFFLNGEHVRRLPIVAFRPEMTAVFGADELRRDPQPIASLANRAFQHGIHLELPADAPDVGVGLLHAERRGSRRDAQALHFAQAVKSSSASPLQKYSRS